MMRSALVVFLFALTACGPASTDACRNGTCQGCCTSDDRCESGLSQLACGQSGDQCTQCMLGTTCTFGLCTANTVSGGGGGTSTGGGTGGGETGGGSGGGVTGGGTGGGVTGGGTGGGETGGGSGGGTMGGGTGGGVGGGAGGGGGGACVPESDVQFCARLRYDCDLVSAFDNCGTNRSANCGSCTSPETCGGSGVPRVCGAPCVPESNTSFCTRLGAACGTRSGTDNCNAARTVANCGSCTVGECQSSSSCLNNTCVGNPRPQGTRCGEMSSASDRNFCNLGVCVLAYSYCDLSSSGTTWTYQTNGTGGVGYGPCTCSSSTTLHFEYNVPNLPIADRDDTCTSCAALGTRRVCF